MALNNYSPSKIYLGISDGHLTRRFKEANENTKQRITKTGGVVHEEHFKDVTGIITSIDRRKHDFGEDLVINMNDAGEAYQIQVSFSSRYTTSFLKALPNVKVSEPVRLMPWTMVDKNDATRKVTGITLYQGKDKILPAYTKDEPNGLPPMVQIKFKGETKWDDTDMMAFLYNKAQKHLARPIADVLAPEPEPVGEDEQPNDLPF